MIVITGAGGFIASAIAWGLNEVGEKNLILVDKLHSENKWKNIQKRDYIDWVDRTELFEWLEENGDEVKAVIHMGACSATTEKDVDFLMKNNYEYSKKLWEFCTKKDINFIYASSAATYGVGEFGYDDEESIDGLMPLNPYGYSKQIFDKWVLKQKETPKQWAGLKFFNVYGPNEYHKKRMASVVYHTFNQVKETGEMKLFKSHKDGYENGYQLRDFIYVKDIIKVVSFFLDSEGKSGIYNLGTGQARAFYDLAKETMMAMGKEPKIDFIDMPVDIRDKYQYFTEAKMDKLKKVGYSQKFYSLEEGVSDYVKNYLLKEDKYL